MPPTVSSPDDYFWSSYPMNKCHMWRYLLTILLLFHITCDSLKTAVPRGLLDIPRLQTVPATAQPAWLWSRRKVPATKIRVMLSQMSNACGIQMVLLAPFFGSLPGSERKRRRRVRCFVQRETAEFQADTTRFGFGDGAGKGSLSAPQHIAMDVAAQID